MVGIILKENFNWYVLPKNLCFLDFTKFDEDELQEILEDEAISKIRKNMLTIQNDNKIEFFNELQVYKIDTSKLKAIYKIESVNNKNNLINYMPVLLFDFNNNQLISYYPEPTQFEYYVGKDFTGKYFNFIDNIPENEKYWK